MERITGKASILLSIFKRKGGEGLLTKIITDENKADYLQQLTLLEMNEKPLLCFKENELNWLLLTNERVLTAQAGVKIIIPFSELIRIDLALHEEARNGVANLKYFTRLALLDQNGNRYLVSVEKGDPYKGIYQMLHYVASNNSATH
ncbi:hypothetical protein [Chitinophaga eiseniae]|uniref:PH domain-containing protein n=1 Tax=Chitinophaga eiseniae TaxID=634771 RepID=A0A847SJ05_9BACT|nr:hypothetical protein [Chitinophaga eiseniae]NLR77346.1 hypothetical protein [Chitinophaga eiseniae]